MEFLESVLMGMKEQEIREFRYFLNRHPQGNNPEPGGIRRDITLMDLIRKSQGNPENEDFARKIYDTRDRNAYHQLRNRLRKSLEEFIFFENSRKGSEFEIRKQVEIARYLFQRKAFQQALLYIQKAEKLATEEKNYTELSALYNLLVAHAGSMPWLSLPEIMEKRRLNNEKLEKHFHYLYVVSQIRDMLSTGEKLGSHIDIDYAVGKLLQQHGISDENPEHAVLWLEISGIVTDVLLSHKLNEVLEQYLVLKHREYGEKPVYSGAGNGFRLRMLWQIIGLMYRNHKFDMLEKYLFELRYEAGKLRDIYPELCAKVQLIEGITGIKTKQYARCRQILESISPESVPEAWLTWAQICLAEKENNTSELIPLLASFKLQNLSPSSDNFLLSLDIFRAGKHLPENTPGKISLEEIRTHFKPWLSTDTGLVISHWLSTPEPKPRFPYGRLPEAGSLGFLIHPDSCFGE